MECATLSVHPPVSLLSILLFIYLLSDWRRLSPQHFLSQIDLLVSIEQLSFHHRSRSALSRLRCNKHILPLTAYLSRIGRDWHHTTQTTSYLIFRNCAVEFYASLSSAAHL